MPRRKGKKSESTKKTRRDRSGAVCVCVLCGAVCAGRRGAARDETRQGAAVTSARRRRRRSGRTPSIHRENEARSL